MENQITQKKIEQYISTTEKALRKVRIVSPKGTHLNKIALDFFDMADRYFEDAKHFMKKEDYVNAFAAVNYAHGWLDAGARIGLFDVDHDSKLFTVD